MIAPAAKLFKEPTCDDGGGGLMASFTDADGNVLGLFGAGCVTVAQAER